MASFSFHPALPAGINVPATLDFARPFVPQVQKILESAGPGLREADEIAVSGQAVAAILMVAGLEMVSGLRDLTLYSFGQKVERVGKLNLNDWRHNVVRSQRGKVPKAFLVNSGEYCDSQFPWGHFTVLDGSGRGMTAVQLGELAAALDVDVAEIHVLNVCTFGQKDDGQADFKSPTVGMIESVLKSATVSDWAARKVLYLPAGSGLAAVIQAVAINGLSESWPRTIRLAAGPDKVFHLAEVVDPQDMRSWGTALTAKWAADQTGQVLAGLAADLESFGVSVRVDGGRVVIATPGGAFEMAVSTAKKLS